MISAYLQLSRPINGLIAFCSVYLGAMFAIGMGERVVVTNIDVFLAASSAFLLLSAGNALNDYCDYEIDRINKPGRPIPSARISRQGAMVFSIILIGLGILLGFAVNVPTAVITVIVSGCLCFYAFCLKQTPLFGNLLVGVLTGLTFIVGGTSVKTVYGTFVPAVFAFLFTTAREIIKDIEDMEGDVRNDARTIPAVWGKRVAVLVALIFITAVILFSPIPYLMNWYSWHYLLTVIVGVDLVLIYLGFRLWRNDSKANSAKIQKWMKWDIFIGLGAIYLGSSP